MKLIDWVDAFYARQLICLHVRKVERDLMSRDEVELEISSASLNLHSIVKDRHKQPIETRSTVNPITLGHLAVSWSEAKSLPAVSKYQVDLENASYLRNGNSEAKTLADTPIEILLNNSFGDYPFLDLPAYCGINLAAPMEVLIKDFEEFVEHYRRVLKIEEGKRQLTKVDMERWHLYMVLPYMDIKIWSDLNGITMTNHNLGRILFPDEFDVDVTERVRNTTKPLSDGLLSEEMFKPVSLQAHV